MYTLMMRRYQYIIPHPSQVYSLPSQIALLWLKWSVIRKGIWLKLSGSNELLFWVTVVNQNISKILLQIQKNVEVSASKLCPSIVSGKTQAIWLQHTSTSYSPSGIRQGYKLEANHYIMQAELVMYLFSWLTPKARQFFRAVGTSC